MNYFLSLSTRIAASYSAAAAAAPVKKQGGHMKLKHTWECVAAESTAASLTPK
jgi:hypothetical protein